MRTTEPPPTESASITFVSGPLQGQTFALTNLATIGSDPANDIVIRDADIAPRHVRIVKGDAVWRLQKEPQVGVVMVDARQVSWAVLRDRAIVGLGAQSSFVFSLRTPSAPADPTDRPPLSVERVTRSSAPPSVAASPGGQRMSSPPAALRRATQASEPARAVTTKRLTGPNETEIAPITPAGGRPYLEVRDERAQRTYQLDGTVIDIGRDPANDIVLDDLVVSAQHLRILREGNAYILVHPHPDRTQTLNGLLYQGRHIPGDEQFRKVLANGDVFRIGNEYGTLVTLAFHDGSGTVEVLPPVQPQPIRLGEPVLSIGRRPDCKIVLPHPQVSALHALLVREGGTYRLLDQHSTNGVYVNGEARTDCLLELGDEIRIGPYRLVYETNLLTQYDESKFVGIQAVDLWKTGTNEIVLLNNISICIPPRAFVALVGGSGAGKSTLMDALNGLRPAQSGQVSYNRHDFYANRAAFAGQMGYVPQDDIVHKDLTVERALYYAAKLRLPSDFTDEQIEQRIKEVLEDVEMVPRRNLLVKKLSGGQRKRVSIALELLANPSLFFLDEPTSGLDPGLDRKMMFLLRQLADRGHTIVLVTHATNNISACDYICFLAQGGRLAYFGPPEEAKEYFGTSDFAEIYTSLEPTDANPTLPAEAEARFKQSPAYQDYVARPLAAAVEKTPQTAQATPAVRPSAEPAKPLTGRSPKRGNPFKQFGLLTSRRLELLRNDRTTLALLLLQAPVMALLVMLLVRSSDGAGLFDQTKAVQCAPQILQTVVTVAPSDANPTGSVRLGIDTSKSSDPNAPVDCTQIRKLLSGDPGSQASAQMTQLAKDYTQHKGGGNVETALQDFIIAGTSLNTLTTLFIVAFLAVLPGCINGVREIVKESSIYRRERAVNLGIIPYVGSKIAIMGGFAVLQAVTLLLVVNLFEPFRTSIFLPVLLEVFISIVLVALSGLMLGLAVSAFAANEDSANTLLPFILIPEVVFAGAEFPLKDLPLQVFGMLDPMRWAIVALGSSAGLHSDKLGGDTLLGTDNAFHATLFSTYSQTDATHRLLLAWGALGAIIVVLAVLVCIGLKTKDVGRGNGGIITRLRARKTGT
jgi:ABC-type multidrug transport system ATPase subunit/pSer/pThr/pTyr-binding forkhead associated (FHA) protein